MTIDELIDLNPWKTIPHHAPFVTNEDEPFVEKYNTSVPPENSFHVELYPEQYAGNFEAPVVILGKCPGFHVRDKEVHSTELYQKLWHNNIRQKNKDYPLFFLDPSLENTPCHKYWYKKLKPLIEHTSLEHVAQNVLEVQLFPYHCKNLKENTSSKSLPSREFAAKLVDTAVNRRAIIIAMMKKNDWEKFVPSLSNYSTYFEVSSPRVALISPNNLPGIFKNVVDAISTGQTTARGINGNTRTSRGRDLPQKEDADCAIAQLIDEKKEAVVESILNQIETNCREANRLLKPNWRMITERNLREYWYK